MKQHNFRSLPSQPPHHTAVSCSYAQSQMRQEFSKLEAAAEDGAADAAAGGAALGADLSLKPGQTIRINLSSVSGVAGLQVVLYKCWQYMP
jgi:hypothetical protein